MNDSQKLDLLLVKFDGMSSDIKILKEDVAVLKEDVAVLKEDVKKLDLRVSKLEEQTAKLEKEQAGLTEICLETRRNVSDISLKLENVIQRDIKRVAEGHSDLSRNLLDVTHTSNEFELVQVRLSSLESRVTKVEKIAFAE